MEHQGRTTVVFHTGQPQYVRCDGADCVYLDLPFTENVIRHLPTSQLELVLGQESWNAVLELAVYQESPALAGRLGANCS